MDAASPALENYLVIVQEVGRGVLRGEQVPGFLR